MSITIEQVRQVAALSRLHFSDQEAAAIAIELSAVLEYFDKLNEIDTKGVEPMSHASGGENVFRPDSPDVRVRRDAVLGNAPDADSEYFRVPKVIRKL